jgi:hypothetical protein
MPCSGTLFNILQLGHTREATTSEQLGFSRTVNMQSVVKVAEDVLLQVCCEVWVFDDDYPQTCPVSQDVAKNTREQKEPPSVQKTPHSDSRGADPNMRNSLLRLPAELQVMILQHLTFGQVESLRRTCRALRFNFSKPVIRFVFPSIKSELLSTCHQCLAYDPERESLIKADESDARYPLANECIDCVAARGGFSVGHSYTLASRSTVCVCRYCGFPVTSDAAWKEYEFHRKCYKQYRMILLYYFLSGFAQGTITIVASAMCWRYYKGRSMIIIPTIVSKQHSPRGKDVLTDLDQLSDEWLGIQSQHGTRCRIEDVSLVSAP